jgi:glycosyltransferase involved in cell wall biosynthesis
MNVTDAIGSAANHGITRTERRIAAEIATLPGVEFVVKRRGSLWTADQGQVLSRLARRATGVDAPQPTVERFGIDAPPQSRRTVQIRLRQLTAERRTDAIRLAPYQHRRDSTIVSVGLDWTNDFLSDAEHAVFGAGARFLGLCYDTIPIDHPEWLYPPDPSGFREYLRRLGRVADRVVCISESTRSDFRRHFPSFDESRLPVLTLGADASSVAGDEHLDFVDRVVEGRPFALYCATIDRRKNHRLLYRAMRMMVANGLEGVLVFVGALGYGVDDLIETLRHDSTIRGRILHVTGCDDAHLAAFYRQARFAVYPSLYEGWGLGVTEALAHGKRCLTATGSSLQEASLGLDHGLHPLKPAQWSAAMADEFANSRPLPPLSLPTWRAAAQRLHLLAST